MSIASWVSRPSRASSRVSTEAIRRVSMLPPRSTRPTLRPGETIRRREHRSEAGGAGAFDDGLLDRDQDRQRAFDLVFSDEDDVIDEMAHDVGGDPARRLDGDAFGERVAAHGEMLS